VGCSQARRPVASYRRKGEKEGEKWGPARACGYGGGSGEQARHMAWRRKGVLTGGRTWLPRCRVERLEQGCTHVGQGAENKGGPGLEIERRSMG
jgi:hypothetical protein